MLVTSKEMLEKARREHYAVPAMNTQGGNYDIIWAICRAAEEMHSPAILAHYVATGRIQEMTGLWKYANGVQTK